MSKCRSTCGPAQYHRQIKVQRPSETQDGFGEADITWSPYTTLYASIKPLSGRELTYAQAIHADVSHEIMVPWSRTANEITPKYRILYGERVFNIFACMNVDEANQQIRVLCREVVT